MRIGLSVVCFAVIASGAAAAPALESAIAQCAGQSDATARLACYDAIAAQMKTSSESTAPAAAPAIPVLTAPATAAIVTAAPPVRQTAAAFGAENLGKEARVAAGEPEPLSEIHGLVKAIAYAPNGRVIVTLDNGQVWRQIAGDTEHFRGGAGDAITISRGILGSYNLTSEAHNELLKVQRVQ